jgi:hypothetical protein
MISEGRVLEGSRFVFTVEAGLLKLSASRIG